MFLTENMVDIMDSEAYNNDNFILDPESYRCKEIYAYFGLAMFHIQCLERTLSMLNSTVYNSDADHTTRLQFDSLLEANFEKTFGQYKKHQTVSRSARRF